MYYFLYRPRLQTPAHAQGHVSELPVRLLPRGPGLQTCTVCWSKCILIIQLALEVSNLIYTSFFIFSRRIFPNLMLFQFSISSSRWKFRILCIPILYIQPAVGVSNLMYTNSKYPGCSGSFQSYVFQSPIFSPR